MIHAIKISALRNVEFTQFLDDVLTIIKENGATELHVQKQYEKLLALSQEIEDLFKLPTGSIISTELLELDLRRDNAINGITAAINSGTYSSDPVIRSHAKLLENHLSVFGTGIARYNLQSETGTLRNIISDWDKQHELKTALEALNLQSWRTEIEEANNLFKKRYLARAKETGSASDDSLRAKRLEAYDAYYALRNHLEAHFTINEGAEPFGSAVSYFNGLVDKYNALIDRRVNSNEQEPEPVAAA